MLFVLNLYCQNSDDLHNYFFFDLCFNLNLAITEETEDIFLFNLRAISDTHKS